MILFSLESWSMHFSLAKHKQSFSSVSPAPEHFLVSTSFILVSPFFFFIRQRDNEANPIVFHLETLKISARYPLRLSSGVCFANNLKFVLFFFIHLFIYFIFFPPFHLPIYPSLAYSRVYISFFPLSVFCRFVYFFFSFSFNSIHVIRV